MDWKIGEIRQVNDEWYQCLEDTNGCHCDCCDLNGLDDCYQIVCMSDKRIDNKDVYFKKLEKVGETIVYINKTFQRLKPIDNYYCKHCYFRNQACNSEICGQESFLVEIKQNKEDMEEYKMYDAKEDIPEFDKVVDECLFGKDKLNLKPFDIQKAKEGKPVCTRDGRSARIVCFDRVTNTTNEYTGHLIVLVTNPNGDEQSFYYTEKGNLAGEDEYDNHKWDLMMLPEKKEGWAKVRKDINLYDTKEEADRKMIGNDEYVTAKVCWEE